MKRRLFFLERLLYGDGVDPFHAVFPVTINGSFSAQALQMALAKVQAKHPLLHSCIEAGTSDIPYFVTKEDVPAIPVRIVERQSDKDWIRESKREWVIPYDLKKGPLIRIVWLRSPSVSDLLLSFHHCICNGSSCLMIMQEILNLLDKPDLDIGRYSHFITPEELLAEYGQNDKARRKAKWKTAIFGFFLTFRAALIDKKKAVPICREKDYLINWKLDETTTRTITDHCKQRQVTVNTALCAAFMSAFQYVRGTARYREITVPVDIRKYLPAEKRDNLFSFGLAITLRMKKERSGFWDKATKLQKEAAKKIAALSVAEFLLPLECAHGLFRPLMKTLRYGKRKTNLILSNMGRLDLKKQYGSFRLETVYSPTVIGSFGDPTDIVTTTFEGRMDFCFLSNEEFLPYADALAIKAKAMEMLT